MPNLARKVEVPIPELSLVGLLIEFKSGETMKLAAKYDYMGEEKGRSIFASNTDFKEFPYSDILAVYDHRGDPVYAPRMIKPRDVTRGMGLHNFKPA